MVVYIENVKQVGCFENVIGWYYSYFGYGCWFFGIDVSIQMFNQQFQELFVVVVIDLIRIIFVGKVNFGVFRIYLKGYKFFDEGFFEYQIILFNKIEDFGVYCK